MNNKNAKFLVVDDDLASVELVKAVLMQEAYDDVDTFLNSQEAQKSYQDKKYDVLIVDLCMPHMSGFDILKEIQETHDHKPSIIVITAHVDPDNKRKALQLGAKKVFFKPYKVSDFLQEVESLLTGIGSSAT